MESISNVNDYVRKMIAENVGEKDDFKTINFMLKVKGILSSDDEENKFFKEAFLSVLYLDRYKELYDDISIGGYDIFSMSEFVFYNDVESLEEYQKQCLADDNELYKVMNSSKFFYECPTLFKKKIMCNLTNDDDEFLIKKTPYHNLDVQEYKKIASMEDIYEYVKNERSDMKEAGILDDYDFVYIINILNYFKINSLYNIEGVQLLLKEIIDYVINNYDQLSEEDQEKYNCIVEAFNKDKDYVYNSFNIDMVRVIISAFIKIKSIKVKKVKVYKDEKDEH